MTKETKALRDGSFAAVVVGLCLLVAQGCGLDKVSVPAITGPAELGISLKLTVNPDILTADGFSTALVQAEVRGPNGQALANVDVYFTIADESGHFADIGTLNNNRAVTNSQGLAQVIYTAPPRTDATANQTLTIVARPVQNDANGQIYREVRLELRSAEPRLFPQNPDNSAPTCQFVIETPEGFFAGVDILFQDTSFDNPDNNTGRVGTIVRYYWDFGDGNNSDKPDVNHRYGLAGAYTVSHRVTDDDGLDDVCTLKFTLN